MKSRIKKGKANGKDAWILSMSNDGKRWRKYFKTFVEAKNFDVVEFLNEQEKVEPSGTDTPMAVAVREHLVDYARRYPGLPNRGQPIRRC